MDSKYWKWISLIIFGLVVFACLSYYGVLPQEGIRYRCGFPVQLQCSDFQVLDSDTSTFLTFTLINGIGKDISIIDLNASSKPDTLNGPCNKNSDFQVPVKYGDKVSLNLTCSSPKTKLFDTSPKKYLISLQYLIAEDVTPHSIQGEILTKRNSNSIFEKIMDWLNKNSLYVAILSILMMSNISGLLFFKDSFSGKLTNFPLNTIKGLFFGLIVAIPISTIIFFVSITILLSLFSNLILPIFIITLIIPFIAIQIVQKLFQEKSEQFKFIIYFAIIFGFYIFVFLFINLQKSMF